MLVVYTRKLIYRKQLRLALLQCNCKIYQLLNQRGDASFASFSKIERKYPNFGKKNVQNSFLQRLEKESRF